MLQFVPEMTEKLLRTENSRDQSIHCGFFLFFSRVLASPANRRIPSCSHHWPPLTYGAISSPWICGILEIWPHGELQKLQTSQCVNLKSSAADSSSHLSADVTPTRQTDKDCEGGVSTFPETTECGITGKLKIAVMEQGAGCGSSMDAILSRRNAPRYPAGVSLLSLTTERLRKTTTVHCIQSLNAHVNDLSMLLHFE